MLRDARPAERATSQISDPPARLPVLQYEWMRRLRVYAGRCVVVIADAVLRELALAPEQVRGILKDLPADAVERITLTEEIGRLRDAYVREGVLGRASRNGAEHIASASVAVVDLLISWNFKHIVHFDKITGFEAVNLLHGYRPIRIYSPREVVDS